MFPPVHGTEPSIGLAPSLSGGLGVAGITRIGDASGRLTQIYVGAGGAGLLLLE